MSAVPIRYARDNVLFDYGGRSAAVYRLPSVSYALLSTADKWGWLLAQAGLAYHTAADITIWRVQRQWPVEDYVAQAADLVDERFQSPEAWEQFLQGHVPHIAQLESYLPEVYLRVGQQTPTGGMRRSVDKAYRRVNDAFGVSNDAPIAERDIRAVLEDEEGSLDRVRSAFPAARRITVDELQWLCRRSAVRHVAEPALDPHWQPDAMVIHGDDGLRFYPRVADFLQLFNASIVREDDHVVVQGDGPRTYQAFLTLGVLPEETRFPGAQAELMFRPLDALPFPVDAVGHFQWMGNRKALSEVNKAIVDAENAVDEATTGTQQPDDRTLLTPELGRELKTYLQGESRPPLLDGYVSFAVSASTLPELKRRCAALKEQFSHVILNRPAGLQELLYYEHLLGPAGSRLPDYDQKWTLEQFGMLMPVATRDVGSPRGPYAGHTVVHGRPRAPVKSDLTESSRDALPSSVYCAGRQGSGKTNGALILATLAALRGSYVLTADPKPDHHIADLPEFAGQSQTITLEGSEDQRGTLDPLVVAPAALREELALSYYLDVLPPSAAKGDWESELAAAVRVVLARETAAGSLAVIEVLEEGNAAAIDAARRLRIISDSGLGVLAFGDGSGRSNLTDMPRVTTLAMANLDLPPASKGRDQYERSERIAVATFRLVVAKIMGLVTHDRTIHKVVVLDEAWALPPALLDKLVRLGRSYNVTVIICSQTVMDLGELTSLIGMYFLFGVNSAPEASLGLKLLGLDPNDTSLIARLVDKQSFAKGRCLHRDLSGRVAEVQIDAVYAHILEALDTTPRMREPIAV